MAESVVAYNYLLEFMVCILPCIGFVSKFIIKSWCRRGSEKCIKICIRGCEV